MPQDLTLPKKPLSFILHFLKPYSLECAGILIVSLLWAVDLSLRPYLTKIMLDKLELSLQKDNLFRELLYPATTYILLSFLMNLIYRLYDYFSLRMMPGLYNDIVLKMLDYTQHHSHNYFQNNFGGSIVNKISEMASSAQHIVEIATDRFFSHILALVFACLTMASVHPTLAAIFLVWVFFFLAGSYYLSKEPHQLSQELSETQTTLIGKIIDSITNMLAVRLYARQRYELKYIQAQAQKREIKAQALRWSNLKRQAGMETASNILIGALLCYLIYARQQGKVTIGDFALILALSMSAVDAVWNLSRDFLHYSENLGRCTQTLTLIAVPPEISDTPNAVPLKRKQGKIEFQNVSFSYPSGKALFENLSVLIPPKQRVGLVGFSGSGKTTFINLIIRLFDIQNGKILIDDQDISQVTQDSLHGNISFIPQDPLLFHRTIFENIKYGNLKASQEDVIKAAKLAHAHDFIQSLPEGYDTEVGERGIKLSGGQRQRIAIARAILKNAKVLILDEATSALDSVTEHHIQESLEVLMKDKTVLVIAHRLSTLMDMNRILVFDRGKIIEDGSHQALLNKGGVYEHLWEMQAGGFLPTDLKMAS